MLLRDKLAEFCHTFLKVDNIPDSWCKNGLQVSGKTNIQKIALGTTASKNFLQMAKDWQADAAIVHHGLFWGRGVQSIGTELSARLKILFEGDLSLFNYHIPLDAHPEIGNNAQIAKRLGLKNIKMVDICAVGDLPKPLPFTAFQEKCADLFGQEANFAEDFLQKEVSCVGICSGGGSDFAEHCRKAGADTFLTGEISEHHYHDFSEIPLNFLACGHHATERFGIQALGEVLKTEFPDTHISFFTEPCPV